MDRIAANGSDFLLNQFHNKPFSEQVSGQSRVFALLASVSMKKVESTARKSDRLNVNFVEWELSLHTASALPENVSPHSQHF